ncbi:MAG: family 10 glycosylhydrolase [Bacteroidaceae bacterium]|nr:family 10 glycosylhydrolase [Bacteroidaceae bacterium]
MRRFLVFSYCLFFSLCLHAVEKRAYMWIDATANFERFSQPDSIQFYLQKLSSIGFTDVVVDVRPISGEVLFDSKLAPKMREWGGHVRPDFDYLSCFISQAHALGLKVHASMNVFVAGHNYHDRGQIYTNHPEWASIVYDRNGTLRPITEQKEKYSAMVNPINRSFQRHICQVSAELVKKYPSLDGILFDRIRYDGIEADFSPSSRKAFERFLHQKLDHFPDDIFLWKNGQLVRGKWFCQWLEWRASVITEFMGKLRRHVKQAHPTIAFGTYTGAWYPYYYEMGVNFASQRYQPYPTYDWATPTYHRTGYAELLDTYIAGNYYTDISLQDAIQHSGGTLVENDVRNWSGSWYCVEGSCQKLRTLLYGRPFISGLLADQHYDNPQRLARAIAMSLRESDGVMIFDICHLISHPVLWPMVEQGMREGGMLH